MLQSVNIPNAAAGKNCGPKPPTSPPASRSQSSSGYAPVRYGIVQGGPDAQQFYGTLIDPSSRPTEVFCRLADALFFHMDQTCGQLHNTQHIEPDKFGIFMRSVGIDAATVAFVEPNLDSLYNMASVPYEMVTVNGANVPILNRRAWLHLVIFEARVDPEAAYKSWYKTLSVLGLRDPATELPFPTTIPRSAFPDLPDQALKKAYDAWQAQVVVAASRLRYVTMTAGTSSAGSSRRAAQIHSQIQANQNVQQMLQAAQKIRRSLQKARLVKTGLDIVSTVSALVRPGVPSGGTPALGWETSTNTAGGGGAPARGNAMALSAGNASGNWGTNNNGDGVPVLAPAWPEEDSSTLIEEDDSTLIDEDDSTLVEEDRSTFRVKDNSTFMVESLNPHSTSPSPRHPHSMSQSAHISSAGAGQSYYPGPPVSPPTSQGPYGASGGYTPVQYNVPGGQDPQQFYGSLLDASNHPTGVFCRLADSLFFHMDQAFAQLRGTQCIEPAKYGAFMRSIGADATTISFLEPNFGSYYDVASVPYKIVIVNGAQVPVLDRHGWLRLAVFETRADPENAHKAWSKSLNMLGLRDPATNSPFPIPLPRSAFPPLPDWGLKQMCDTWQVQLVVSASRQRSQAAVAGILGTASPLFSAGAGGSGGAAQVYGQVQANQNAQTLQMMQQMQANQRKASMVKAGVNIVSTLMGAPTGFGGLGN